MRSFHSIEVVMQLFLVQLNTHLLARDPHSGFRLTAAKVEVFVGLQLKRTSDN
ncbi:conserved hypothetical protein [Ricinus communis]|uniref:Uncharacterized protein n=1 Tax=Ricinus communis TaxID=3988 RepID=B9SG86_RICCO|nr:conserved hypothetical protein [Ricinus communis]